MKGMLAKVMPSILVVSALGLGMVGCTVNNDSRPDEGNDSVVEENETNTDTAAKPNPLIGKWEMSDTNVTSSVEMYTEPLIGEWRDDGTLSLTYKGVEASEKYLVDGSLYVVTDLDESEVQLWDLEFIDNDTWILRFVGDTTNGLFSLENWEKVMSESGFENATLKGDTVTTTWKRVI